MPVRRAAGSADELALLRAVVADLSAATPALVYADWLDDHGDPRGPFLREFLAAFDARRSLPPDPPGLNPAWADVLALPLRRRMRTDYSRHPDEYVRYAWSTMPGGFTPLEYYLPDILRSPLPALSLTALPRVPITDCPIGTSRANGLPDLPPGTPWPTFAGREFGETGVWPLRFLLQIDLSELDGTLADGMLPRGGLLTLFHWPQLGEADTRVFYTPSGSPLARREPPRTYNWHPSWRGAEEFATDATHPLLISDWLTYPMSVPGVPEHLQPEMGPDSPLNLTRELIDNGLERNERGGRVRCSFDGMMCANPLPPGFCWRWEEVVRYYPEYTGPYLQLFELDSSDELLWGFGDGDALHVYAPAEDAARGVFDRLIYDES